MKPRPAIAALLLSVGLVAGTGSPARAAEALPAPTVFDGAYQGRLVGAVAGTATGYLFARSDTGNESGGWKPLVYGAGIGALSGAALGLTLGIIDMSQSRPRRNGYVMRDGLYGAGLGLVLGGIAGGLGALASQEAEHILLGMSIGVLSGTLGGMAVGFAEGYRKYSVTATPVRQADGSMSFLPAVAGRY